MEKFKFIIYRMWCIPMTSLKGAVPPRRPDAVTMSETLVHFLLRRGALALLSRFQSHTKNSVELAGKEARQSMHWPQIFSHPRQRSADFTLSAGAGTEQLPPCAKPRASSAERGSFLSPISRSIRTANAKALHRSEGARRYILWRPF